MTALAFPSASPRVLTLRPDNNNGLVGRWPVSAPNSTGNIVDGSGRNNNLAGLVTVGNSPYGLKFVNNTTAYAAQATNPQFLTPSLTFSAWVNPAVSFAANHTIFGGGSPFPILFINTSGHITWTKNGSGNFTVAPNALVIGQWVHAAGTYQTGIGWVLYINGLAVSTSATLATWATTGIMGIGGAAFGFLGSIADVRAYNRALSASEVYSLYAQPLAPSEVLEPMALLGSTAISLALAANDAEDVASFNLAGANNLTLAANDAQDTAAFNLAAANNLILSANDATDTASFNITATVPPSVSLTLAANDAQDVASFEVTVPVVPSNPNDGEIVPQWLYDRLLKRHKNTKDKKAKKEKKQIAALLELPVDELKIKIANKTTELNGYDDVLERLYRKIDENEAARQKQQDNVVPDQLTFEQLDQIMAQHLDEALKKHLDDAMTAHLDQSMTQHLDDQMAQHLDQVTELPKKMTDSETLLMLINALAANG